MPPGSELPTDSRIAYLKALCRTVPHFVVEAVLREPTEHAIKPQYFDGSLLVADLVGFTALCEKLAAKGSEGLSQLSQILDRLFQQLLEDAIHPYEGYVVHFGGDSATAVFRGEDHARRCAAAALACQRLMHGEMGRMPGGQRHELMLRVGVASGEVRLWIVGDMVRRSVVCTGATVHRAVGMQRLAQPGAVVADRAALALLGTDAETIDRQAEHGILRGLRVWPETKSTVELTDRFTSGVEEKISLLEPFVPEPLAVHMRSAPSGWRLRGELREAVIVFVEISGLDEASGMGEMAMNVSRSLLRAYRKYGGVVHKVDLAERGHRIMALFGLHDPRENDVERALLASLEVNTRLKAFTISSKRVDLVVRAGVHQGRVYFGAIGSDHKHDITVVGDAVNVAARAASSAEPFEVVATETVAEQVADEFATSARPPIFVKGRATQLKLVAIHAAAEGRARYVRRRQSQRFCAGRRRETEELLAIGREALTGHGRFIGLVGPPGSGKSFMLANLIDSWVEAGGLGVIGRCRYAGRSQPLAPIVSIFHNFLGIAATDNDATRRERIRAGFQRFTKVIGVHELIALLEPVQRPDGTNEALVDLADPQARERILAGILTFFLSRTEQVPLLVIIEDLHLGDTLTLELAARISATPRQARFLLVVTSRPEPAVRDVRRVLDREIELKTLTLDQTIEVLQHELRAKEVEPSIARFVFERTSGNPEHLIEVVRFLVDRQLLLERGGVVVAAEPGIRMLEDVVPRTLSQVVMARLQRLGVVERRLVRLASVIGQRFGKGLLQLVAESEVAPDLLDSGMAKLVGLGVISAEADGEASYVFHDDITRAVAYGTIPDAERQDVHRRIADAIQQLDAHDPARIPATLAMHRERAGELQESARWYQEAARMSAAAGLDRETRVLIDRWAKVVEAVPPAQRPASFTVAQIKVMKLVATGRLGFPAEVMRLGRELAQHHAKDLDGQQRNLVDLWVGDALLRLGRPEKARSRLQRAFTDGLEPLLRSDAARLMARTHELAHEAGMAEHWLDQAKELCRDDVLRAGRIDIARANLVADKGDLDGARAIYARVRDTAQAAQMLHLRVQATANSAYCDMEACDFEAARRGFEEAITMDRALGLWHDEAQDLVNLGQSCLWEGRLDEAQGHLDKGMAIALELGEDAIAAEAQVHLGAVVALTLDPEAGAVMCEEGFKKAVRGGLREVEVAAELHMLRIAVARRDAKGAEVALHRCAVQQPHMRWPLFKKTFETLKSEAATLIS
jgi:adenylate cyclase